MQEVFNSPSAFETLPAAFAVCAATFLCSGPVLLWLIQQRRYARAALDNMSQGLGMFDSSGRLVLFNRRYANMYSLKTEFLRRKPTLAEILRERSKIGLFAGNPEERMRTLVALMHEGKFNKEVRQLGSAIYRICNLPTPGGGWVSTHDDITEESHVALERERLTEQERRRISLDEAISSFQERVELLLRLVTERATALRSTSSDLLSTADQASRHADSAVQSSELASGSVKVAADVADALASSIAMTAMELDQSKSLVNSASDEADITNMQMEQMMAAVDKIGAVLKVIQKVAAQTNLLALNATIEAARAGEAGRGFSVVASEVKALAIQTATSANEINDQISAVQSSTNIAVSAIRSIAARMGDIKNLTTANAEAVEEQAAATKEIGKNVSNAAVLAKDVASELCTVAGDAGQTRIAAQQVRETSAAVENLASQLRQEVESFLLKVAS
jgi:hypothetical protein